MVHSSVGRQRPSRLNGKLPSKFRNFETDGVLEHGQLAVPCRARCVGEAFNLCMRHIDLSWGRRRCQIVVDALDPSRMGLDRQETQNQQLASGYDDGGRQHDRC
jgi:hypothetical protein